jgi:excisionase family DNA binding protein
MNTDRQGSHLIPSDQAGALPVRERYAITVKTASEYIGISRSRIYELLTEGDLEGRVIRGRRVVLVSSLMKMLGEAPTAKREAAA